jgi:hypothetical protein
MARHAIGLLLVTLLMAACGAPTPVGPGGSPTDTPTATPAVSPSPSPSPTATPAPSPSPSATPLACFPITGGSSTLRATITDLRVGSHPGYDRLVIELSGGVPTYRIEAHDINGFVGSFRGDPVKVAGGAGLILHLYNQDLPPVFAHGTDLLLDSSQLKEVVVLGDFEGQADLGIGLGQLQCPVVSIYDSPPRLVIDFPTA